MSTSNNNNKKQSIQVTFSDADEEDYARLKSSIDSKFHDIHQRYHVTVLDKVVCEIWKLNSIVVSNKSFFMFCKRSGLWLRLPPRKALTLTIELLLYHQAQEYEAVCKRLEKVLDKYVKAGPLIIERIRRHVDNIVASNKTLMKGFATGYHFENGTFERARKQSNDPDFEDSVDAAKDVIAAPNSLFRVSLEPNLTFKAIDSTEEQKSLRLTRCIVTEVPNVHPVKLGTTTIQTLASVICEVLFANRIPPRTFVQLVGDGAEKFALKLSECCGEDMCPEVLLEKLNPRQPFSFAGQRLVVFPDGSSVSATTICKTLRRISKNKDDTGPLPIISVSPGGGQHYTSNQTPINPDGGSNCAKGPCWNIVYVRVDHNDELKASMKLSPPAFLQFLAERYSSRHEKPKPASDAEKDCIDEILDAALKELGWKSTGTRTRSRLSVLSSAVKKIALEQNSHKFNRSITHPVLANLLEKRGFTVINPGGILYVLHST